MSKRTYGDSKWTDRILIAGTLISLISGLLMAKFQTTVEVGIEITVVGGLFTLGLAALSELRNLQHMLRFDRRFYRPALLDTFEAIAQATAAVADKKWTFISDHLDSSISTIRSLAEQAILGRASKLGESERQKWLKKIIGDAKRNQEFLATSYVDVGAWWKSPPGINYYRENKAALDRHVKIKRIFVTKSQRKDEVKQEVIRQSNDGIIVRVAYVDLIPDDHKLNFAVLDSSITTWSNLSPGGGSSEGNISFDKDDIERNKAKFNNLWDQYARDPEDVWADLTRNSDGRGYVLAPSQSTGSASVLAAEIKNFLYEHPQFYDQFHRDRLLKSVEMVNDIIGSNSERMTKSLLDIGCGTGFLLDGIQVSCPDSWGIDGQMKMVNYASSLRPDLKVKMEDMRTMDLERRFDCIVALAWVLNYATSTHDADQTLQVMARHMNRGGLLILELINGFNYSNDIKCSPSSFDYKSSDLTAKITLWWELEREKQLLRRYRNWNTVEYGSFEDTCAFRLFFPEEIEILLERNGFRITAIYDDYDRKKEGLRKDSFLVVAQYKADRPLR